MTDLLKKLQNTFKKLQQVVITKIKKIEDRSQSDDMIDQAVPLAQIEATCKNVLHFYLQVWTSSY